MQIAKTSSSTIYNLSSNLEMNLWEVLRAMKYDMLVLAEKADGMSQKEFESEIKKVLGV